MGPSKPPAPCGKRKRMKEIKRVIESDSFGDQVLPWPLAPGTFAEVAFLHLFRKALELPRPAEQFI